MEARDEDVSSGRDEEEEEEEEGTAGRTALTLTGSATLTGVVLGELGCDWANFR